QRPERFERPPRPREAAVDPEAPAKTLSRTARRAAAEDAKLLAAIRMLLSNPSVFPRVFYLAFGFAAITSLGAALAGLLPLPYLFHFAVIPAYAIMALIGLRYPAWGKRALLGLLAGMIATGVYDILRIGLMFAGLWGDPIPSIGRLATGDPNIAWYWGYVWRFVGNGGGMGVAFAMLPWRGVKLGIAYGTAVCLGLVAILYYFPIAQLHFFALTPPTAAGGMAGHWVYGAVLGWLTSRWLPPVGRRRRRPGRARHDRQDRGRPEAPSRSATVLVAVPEPVVGGHGKIAAGPDLVLPGGRLSSDELYTVKCALQQPPRAHGFASDQWTLRRVALVVERATGVRGWQPAELTALLEALELRLPLREQRRDQRDQRVAARARVS
ncbi:MAG TPA: hypothetical protein VG673_19665, partial [Actinomycetota bacterium]|nr:hypothetical protein [Actinomycetota bacterium]